MKGEIKNLIVQGNLFFTYDKKCFDSIHMRVQISIQNVYYHSYKYNCIQLFQTLVKLLPNLSQSKWHRMTVEQHLKIFREDVSRRVFLLGGY